MKNIKDFENDFIDVDAGNSKYELKLRKCLNSLISFDMENKEFRWM